MNFFGYKDYNGVKCAVARFEFIDEEAKNYNLVSEIWVDSKKGTLLKSVSTGIDSEGENYQIVDEYIVSYNVVTDDDIKKPDLSGYTKME